MSASRTDKGPIIGLIAGYFLLQPLATDLLLATMPSLAREFGTTADRAQLTLSLFILAFGAGQLVAGPLSDRFGRRPVLAGGIAVYALASAGATVAWSIEVLTLLRFVQGLGAACGLVVGRAVVRDHYAVEAGAHTLARVSGLTAMAGLAAPIAGGWLQATVGYRGPFLLMAAIGLALFALHRRYLVESLRTPIALEPVALARGYGAVARDACFWAFTALACASYTAVFGFMAATPRVFIEGFGMAPDVYGYAYASIILPLIVGNLLCRRMLSRYGLVGTVRRASVVTLVAGLVHYGLAQRADAGPWSAILPYYAYVFAHGILMPCAYAGAVTRFADRAGSASALISAIQMTAAAICSQWLSRAYDGSGRPLALLILGTALVAFVASQTAIARQAPLLARYGRKPA